MEKICQHCQQPIINNARLNAKYCCPRCAYDARIGRKRAEEITVYCSMCNKPLKRRLSQLKKSIKKHGKPIVFCNNDCHYEAKKLKHNMRDIWPSHYGSSLIYYRTIAFANFDKWCAKCGFDIKCALDVHHKDNNHSNNDLSNLEILCKNCHAIHHHVPL